MISCGTFQSLTPKVTLERETMPSVISELDRAKVTVAVGCNVSATVKVAVAPASLVCKLSVGVIRIAGSSLRIVARPYASPRLAVTGLDKFTVKVSSSSESVSAVTDTVMLVLAAPAGNVNEAALIGV